MPDMTVPSGAQGLTCDALGKRCFRSRGSAPGRLSNMVAAKGELMESMSSCRGRPVTSMMRSSWFMVEVPGKMGFPPSSSPRMHPSKTRAGHRCHWLQGTSS